MYKDKELCPQGPVTYTVSYWGMGRARFTWGLRDSNPLYGPRGPLINICIYIDIYTHTYHLNGIISTKKIILIMVWGRKSIIVAYMHPLGRYLRCIL